MGVPQRGEGVHVYEEGKSVQEALSAKLAKFLLENEYTKGKDIELIEVYPTESATAFLFELRIPRVSDVDVFSVLKGSNSPLKAIGLVTQAAWAPNTILLEMDIAH